MSWWRKGWLALLCCVLPLVAFAHSVGTSYLTLTQAADGLGVRVQLDLHLRDVELAVGIDANDDGALTWRELDSARALLVAHVTRNLHVLRGERDCALRFGELLVDELPDGTYAVLQADAACETAGPVEVRSELLFPVDAQHRTLVSWTGDAVRSVGVLTTSHRTWQPPAVASRFQELRRFVEEGVYHIWTGFDHLAFLLILLLPAMIVTSSIAKVRDRPVVRVLAIVSAFTLAHSITLGLAVLGYVKLPERPVEVAIAISVILAALANLHPRTRDLGPITAFCFGLLHGFGFASALAGIDLNQVSTGIALADFNIGVELGQLAIVAVVLPCVHLIRHKRFYVMKLVPIGSMAVAGLGTVWLLQRLVP